jgi:cytochrome c553
MKAPRYVIAGLAAGLVFTGAGFAADAATNWTDLCAKCHGADGKGGTKMGKKLNIADLTDAKVQEGFTDADAVKAMKEGIKDKSGKTTMKPIEGLSDDDMKALVPFVRALKK